MSDLRPPGPELRRHNRRLVAERINWPAGAVEACEKLERMQPRWRVRWQHQFGNQAAGWYASHDGHTHLEPDVYGQSSGELWAAMETHRCPAWPPPASWLP